MKKEYVLPYIKIRTEPKENLCNDWNIASGKLEGDADMDDF